MPAPLDAANLRRIRNEAATYLVGYQTKHTGKLESVAEEARELNRATVHEDSPMPRMPSLPADHAEILALLMHQLDDGTQSDESFAQRVRRVLAGKKIVDLGARFGAFVDFLNDHGADAHGVDTDQAASRVARRHKIPVEHRGVDDMEEQEEYHAVISRGFNTDEAAHVPSVEPGQLCKKIARMLIRGGIAIHFVNGTTSLLKPKHLREAGLQVIHHQPFERNHISVARKSLSKPRRRS